jgi:hypothetical protein
MGGAVLRVRTPYMLPARKKKRGRKRGTGRRGKAGTGVFPALGAIGVSYGVTPALCEEATLAALSNTFDEAADAFARRGIPVSAKRVRAISEHFAASALEMRQSELQQYHDGTCETTPILSGQRVAVCIDGGRINIRTPKNGRIPADAKRRGFNANWREPKMFTVYTLDGKGAKRKNSYTLCDGTIANPDAVFDLLAAELYRNGVGEARQLVFLSDGAPWIWNRLDTLTKQLGIPGGCVRKILDFSHAVQHLYAIADLLPGLGGKRKKRWVKKMKKLLKDSADDFLAELSSAIGSSRNKILRREHNYFLKNREHIRYKKFIRGKLPIGSGSVESAIRRVINLRLKGAGMFWLKHNAEGFPHLRCQTKSGNWNSFFHRVLQYLCAGV